jgi:uncharacterized protein
MSDQQLAFSLDLPGVSVERLHAFHASPMALHALTPPGTLLRVEGDLGPLHEGQRVTLHLRKFGLPMRWEAINESVSENGFTDRMLKGPFARWSHRHHFIEQTDGCRLMDELHFQLPLWPLSLPALPLIRADIRKLFAFRHAATKAALMNG